MTRLQVHELAKELGVRSSVVVEALRSSGRPVSSISAVLVPAQIEHVRAVVAARAAASEPQAAYTTSTRSPWVPISELSVLERVVLKRQRRPADEPKLHPNEIKYIRGTVSAWASEDPAFAAPEVLDLWLDTGLSPAQAKECLAEGITPAMLEQRCKVPHKQRPNEILTNGEAVKGGVVTAKRVAQALREEGQI
jgi:hypothetical protein